MILAIIFSVEVAPRSRWRSAFGLRLILGLDERAGRSVLGAMSALLQLSPLLSSPRHCTRSLQLGCMGRRCACSLRLGAIPAIDAAIALVNRGVTRSFGATLLPGLGAARRRAAAFAHARRRADAADDAASLSRSKSSGWRSIISPARKVTFISQCSPTGSMHTSEHAEGDAALLAVAAEGIARLNQRHGAVPGGDRFLLLHRRRVWNEGEGRWIGWERKRGKLHELNRLLRGATDTTFMSDGPASLRRARPMSATSSRSTPTRDCRAKPFAA